MTNKTVPIGITDGIINVYKEKGYTSHDVVAIVRKLTGLKAGHTGTLDPDAEGVLPVCLGKATKLSDYIASATKAYDARVAFGTATDTQDYSGNVIAEIPLSASEEEVISAIKSFIGDYEQVPPMYSALKVDGKKLYELAREGKEVERKARHITIHDIKINASKVPEYVDISVECSKGTYIRTLCVDIGEKLNCSAHMASLVRTRTGAFNIKDSITIGGLRELKERNELESVVLPMYDALSDYRKVVVSAKAEKLLLNGNKVFLNFVRSDSPLRDGEVVVVYDENKCLVGIYTVVNNDEKYIKPLTMLR